MDKGSPIGTLGLIGTILGLFAISIAISHFIFGPIQIPQTSHIKETLKQNHTIAIQIPVYDTTDVTEKAVINLDETLMSLVIGIGLIAIILGVISFIKHEDWRPGVLALILGSGAIAFQFTVAMLLMTLGVVIIIGLLISLGLT